jgi:4-methyl-5(b-hydroxyethyl)-thiazole monophosphate biosynthesis
LHFLYVFDKLNTAGSMYRRRYGGFLYCRLCAGVVGRTGGKTGEKAGKMKEERAMKEVCVFLADGFEEIEGLTVVDILRRAGACVKTISVTGDYTVHGAHQIDVLADELFEKMDFQNMEMLVLPGGMPGTLHLKEHEGLRKLLLSAYERKLQIAAICAAPSILGSLGFLEGRQACAYPSFEEALTGAAVVQKPTVTDGNITTGRGMGAAIAFGLRLVSVLYGEEKAQEVKKAIVYT